MFSALSSRRVGLGLSRGVAGGRCVGLGRGAISCVLFCRGTDALRLIVRSLSLCFGCALVGHVSRCLGLEHDGFTSHLFCSMSVSLCLFVKRSDGFARKLRHLRTVVFLCLGSYSVQNFLVSPSRSFLNGFDRVSRILP